MSGEAILSALGRGAAWIIPLVTALAGGLMLSGRRDLFSSFSTGAADGLRTALRLFPALLAMLCGVAMLRASGLPDLLSSWLSPAFDKLGIPAELTPLLIMRPFSGSASLAVFGDLLTAVGPDSFPALCAAVIMGSSDTSVYVLSVYFSSVGVKKTRWAVPCALAVTVFCTVFCCFVCRILFK